MNFVALKRFSILRGRVDSLKFYYWTKIKLASQKKIP